MNRRGFTLIEIVIMVAVLGILAVLYTSSTGDLSDVSIDASSRKVQADIRYAQHLATKTGVNHGVLFAENGGYEVYRGSSGNPVPDPVTRDDLVVTLEDFDGVIVASDHQFEFDKTGTPVLGGDSRVRLVATSGAIRDVYVVENTGAVVIDLIEYGTGCRCDLCVQR